MYLQNIITIPIVMYNIDYCMFCSVLLFIIKCYIILYKILFYIIHVPRVVKTFAKKNKINVIILYIY